MDDYDMDDSVAERREFLKTGAIGLAGGALLAGAATTLDPKTAAAQAAPGSRTSFKHHPTSQGLARSTRGTTATSSRQSRRPAASS
jgi:hypothetical protein